MSYHFYYFDSYSGAVEDMPTAYLKHLLAKAKLTIYQRDLIQQTLNSRKNGLTESALPAAIHSGHND